MGEPVVVDTRARGRAVETGSLAEVDLLAERLSPLAEAFGEGQELEAAALFEQIERLLMP